MAVKRVNKKNLPFILFFILLLANILVFWARNNQPTSAQKGGNGALGDIESNQQQAAPIKQVDLPIPLNDRNVTSLFLAYNFGGKIKDIQKTNQGYELKLDVTNSSIPSFTIPDKAPIVFTVDSTGAPTPAAVTDLKIGQNVSVTTTYDLRRKNWITRGVYILPPGGINRPSPTPSK